MTSDGLLFFDINSIVWHGLATFKKTKAADSLEF